MLGALNMLPELTKQHAKPKEGVQCRKPPKQRSPTPSKDNTHPTHQPTSKYLSSSKPAADLRSIILEMYASCQRPFYNYVKRQCVAANLLQTLRKHNLRDVCMHHAGGRSMITLSFSVWQHVCP